MKKTVKLIFIFIVILIFGFGFWQLKIKNNKTSIQNEKVVQQISASLKINDGKNLQIFDISGFVGQTALAATQADAKVITSGTGENAFITSINGRTTDTKKREFWELDANGAETQVGAGSYIIKNHDQIEWKISNY